MKKNLTVCKPMCNLGQHKGKIFRPSTEQHADEHGIRLYSGAVESCPWHIYDGVDKC